MAKMTINVGMSEIKTMLLKDAANFQDIHFPNLYLWSKKQGLNTDDARTCQEIAEAVNSLIKEGRIVVVGISSSNDLLGAALLHFNI